MAFFVCWSFSRLLIFLIPGDPVDILMDELGGSFSEAALREALDLNRSVLSRLGHGTWNFFSGQWGTSLLKRTSVSSLILSRLGSTAVMAVAGFFAALLLSLLLASLPFFFENPSWRRRIAAAVDAFTRLTGPIPFPALALILIVIFSFRLGWADLGDSIALPALALAFHFAPTWTRLTSAQLAETGTRMTPYQGAWAAARVRGLPKWRVIVRHLLWPSVGPLAVFWGQQLGGLLGGTFLVEVIFHRPGLGTLLIDAVYARDFPVIETVLGLAIAFSFCGMWLGRSIRTVLYPERATS